MIRTPLSICKSRTRRVVLGSGLLVIASALVIPIMLQSPSASASPSQRHADQATGKPAFHSAGLQPGAVATIGASPIPAAPSPTTAAPATASDGVVVGPSEIAANPPSLPFPAGIISLTSLYQEANGSEYVSIYAGAATSVPTSGEVIVAVDNPTEGPTSYPTGVFALDGSGALTITSVSGTTVSLVDANGVTHEFSIVDDEFS
jgi:hypothetical protein